MESSPANPVTTILQRLRAADDSRAAVELLPILYDELRRMARAKLAGAPHVAGGGQTLQPTALVHEAYMRLVNGRIDTFESRRHFFFVAARAMQDILVEQARRRASLKRGGDRARVPLDDSDAVAIFEEPVEDVAALGTALEDLESSQPRKAQLVRLRYFAGLSMQEIASIMDLSEPTVRRELRFTRALLATQLRGAPEDP